MTIHLLEVHDYEAADVNDMHKRSHWSDVYLTCPVCREPHIQFDLNAHYEPDDLAQIAYESCLQPRQAVDVRGATPLDAIADAPDNAMVSFAGRNKDTPGEYLRLFNTAIPDTVNSRVVLGYDESQPWFTARRLRYVLVPYREWTISARDGWLLNGLCSWTEFE